MQGRVIAVPPKLKMHKAFSTLYRITVDTRLILLLLQVEIKKLQDVIHAPSVTGSHQPPTLCKPNRTLLIPFFALLYKPDGLHSFVSLYTN
jgi:hypothetical protein